MSTVRERVNMDYCCNKFKEECGYDEGIEYTEVYEFDERRLIKGYVFTFEGCQASPRLIYCPFCGNRLQAPDNKIISNYK